MKIKKLKKLRVNSFNFDVKWDKALDGASFNYEKKEICIGIKDSDPNVTFMFICHELMELCAVEMNVRFRRPDVGDDYIFVYDHRQHETMTNLFASLLSQFMG